MVMIIFVRLTNRRAPKKVNRWYGADLPCFGAEALPRQLLDKKWNGQIG